MRDYIDNHSMKLRGETSPTVSLWRSLGVALVLLVIAVLLMVADSRGYLVSVRGAFDTVVGPVAQRMTGLKFDVTSLWSSVDSIDQLQTENAALNEEVRELKAKLIAYEALQIDNNRLRQQLEIEEKHPWNLLSADLVVRSPDIGRRAITIARGQKDGIQIGMAVVGQTENKPAALIGIVESVGPHTASVLLITDLGSRITVRVLSEGSSALGLVTGQWQNGSQLHLEQLDRTLVLEPGMTVVSAGLTGNLGLPFPLASVPAGIPIGTVRQTISTNNFSQIAEVEPYGDLEQLRDVWVILSHTN